MFMTKKRILAVTEEIVRVHAPLILKELQLENDNDGILNRIVVSDKPMYDEETGKITDAIFHHVVAYKEQTFGFLSKNQYEVGSGEITLYPLSNLYFKTKKGKITKLPFVSLVATIMHKSFKRQILVQLAHEMRHYYQFYTNTAYSMDLYAKGSNKYSYEHRWVERDANEFSYRYVRSIN